MILVIMIKKLLKLLRLFKINRKRKIIHYRPLTQQEVDIMYASIRSVLKDNNNTNNIRRFYD